MRDVDVSSVPSLLLTEEKFFEILSIVLLLRFRFGAGGDGGLGLFLNIVQ